MSDFFHLSPKVYAVGDEIRGNGKDKVDPRIENELAATKPPSALSRRDAVFCLEHADFTACGITEPGYIYRVEPTADPERRDFGWIGEMQKALLKIKYPSMLGIRHYPDWNATLIARCSNGYWSAGVASASPGWEFLTSSCVVLEVVANELVDPKSTKGGWRP